MRSSNGEVPGGVDPGVGDVVAVADERHDHAVRVLAPLDARQDVAHDLAGVL